MLVILSPIVLKTAAAVLFPRARMAPKSSVEAILQVQEENSIENGAIIDMICGDRE